MKNNDMRKTTLVTTLVCLVPVIAGVLLYSRLPETIATHWDGAGNVNGWSSKFVGAIVFPGSLVLLNLLVPFLLKTDPKYNNIDKKVKNLIHWIIPVVSIFCSTSTLAAGLGYDSKVTVTGPLLMGLLFIFVGNYLPKTGQSYTVGIKIPWTLADEENWNKTHRMAGYLWVVCGFLMMFSAFLPGTKEWILRLALIMVGAPVAYSYLLFRKRNK